MGKKQSDGDEEVLDEVAEILSHDLENILMTAQSSLELAQRHGDEENFERTAVILDNAQELVDDIVTLARTGQQISDIAPTDLAAVSHRAWQSVPAPETTLKRTTDMTIRADESSLRQLLENLFRNAIEHGGGVETVRVGSLSDGSTTGFFIEDNGKGIPQTDRDRVFDPGYSTSGDERGFGLLIVQRIVEGHQWSISVTNSDTGGARFEIRGIDPAH